MPGTTTDTTADTTADTATLIYRRADVYHDFYRGRGKDYRAEAAAVRDLVAQRGAAGAPASSTAGSSTAGSSTAGSSTAGSLLDVACGTGAHLAELTGSFADAVGVDLSAEMLAVAARNSPGTPLVRGDMRDFRLGRTFSAVTCMFSSVGYLATADDLDAAVRNLADHLAPGGVLVVEPWWFPQDFLPGWVGADVVRADGRTIARVSHTVREGRCSRMEVHYTVAAPETGVEHFTDTHVMTLFEQAEYEAAFHRAGLEPEYVRHELFGPGLFVATRPGGAA
ncbi:class I SAM-dependent methyltransferase [Streptomyces sp. BR123]|uniref:class I SAM-dependent methyltransferase n=1 Tax=Streptomyces sp. BR123 TaxID=2749828 RepID=UPI0015C4895E|nr:class I SAM-dependent methyltransferase [Streptomyces sp. BR123]NXY97069.1 class I SAM-dependent methyltransferase [Streptomyces sp. BR123]